MMTGLGIARQRLHNQQITRQAFEKPGDLVAWLGAVQAQDYAGANGRSANGCEARPTPPSSRHSPMALSFAPT